MITDVVTRTDWRKTATNGLQARLSALEEEVATLRGGLKALSPESRISIICFSGEWDRLFAALTIAAGALAMGLEVHLFFTFWAVSALRSASRTEGNGQSFLQSMFAKILPRGLGSAPLSKFNFGGLGKTMIRRVMKKEGVDDIDVLYEDVKSLGAHFHLCDTTAGLFGLRCADLIVRENVDQCGAATFLSHAMKSKTVLFI